MPKKPVRLPTATTTPRTHEIGELPTDLSHADAPLKGQTLRGLYFVEELIGVGGMGAVYRAKHIHLDRHFAIKVLTRTIDDAGHALERFKREAMAASRIEHDNIVDVVSLDTTEDGEVFIVMELLRGESLGDRIRKGPLPVDSALGITYQLCRALAAAHGHEIVHRDLKPENIFLVDKGGFNFVKVLDFGISKMKSAEAAQVHMTRTGQLVGTPLYMSPEQARGESDVDHRADIYAVGVLLYEMLTGTPPFLGKNYFQLLWKHGNEEVEAASSRAPEAQIPKSLDRLILRTLAKDPADRPPDMATLEAELQRALPHLTPPPSAISLMPSSGSLIQPAFPKSPRKRRLQIFFGALLTLAVLAIIAGNTNTNSTTSPSSGEPAESALEPKPESSAAADPIAPPDAAVLLPDPLPAAAAGVRFASDPPGAAVYLNGQALGTTPFSSTVPVDESQLEVEFRRPGYNPSTVVFAPVDGALIETRLRRRASSRRGSETRSPLKKQL